MIGDTIDTCPGCGLELEPGDGPTHPYMLSSPGCWALYGELLAREYENPEYFGPSHALTVHCYAVQHPGRDERRARQSVALHLAAICLVVERGVPAPDTVALMKRIAPDERERLPHLAPPEPNGTLTVRDALQARSAEEHHETIRAWAADLWEAWAPHHEAARRWAGGALGG